MSKELCKHGIPTNVGCMGCDLITVIHCHTERMEGFNEELKQVDNIYNNLQASVIELTTKTQERHSRQVDENRKVDRIFTELQSNLERQIHINVQLNERLMKLEEYMRHPGKTPHVCPKCDGKGTWFEPPNDEYSCFVCNAEGVVWGR